VAGRRWQSVDAPNARRIRQRDGDAQEWVTSALSQDACCIGRRGRRNGTNSSSATQTQRWPGISSISFASAFALSDDEISIRCWLHADHLDEQARSEQYWLDGRGLPQASLRRSIVNVYSKYSKRKRTGNLPYGTCEVVVSRTWVTQMIYGGIQELGGFTREAWLE
jgi:hypothetical protein